jgi:acyl carrier protein
MDEALKKIILDYIRKEFVEDDDTEVTETTKFISSGLVDSFSMVSLKTFLEKKYQCKLPDEEATPEAFDTVEGIIALVRKHSKSV